MKSATRIVTGAAVAALTAGCLSAVAAPASAAPDTRSNKSKATKFAFTASSYGTRLFNTDNELIDSGRTALALVGCTNETGKKQQGKLAGVRLPSSNPLVKVGAMTTTSRSMKIKGGAKAVATTRVGDIVIGNGLLGKITLKGIRGQSVASNKNGKYSQSGSVRLADIKVSGPGGLPLPDPPTLPDPSDITPGDGFRIPGVAKITFLATKGKVAPKRKLSQNSSVAVQIKILAPLSDLKNQTLRVGSTWARIAERDKNARVRGYGRAASGNLLNGLVTTGKVANQHMPCYGTDGEWLSTPTAAVNEGRLKVDGAYGKVRGVVVKGRKPLAASRAGIEGANVLGQLKIGAVRSNAKVVRSVTKKGKVVYKRTSGSKVFGLRAGGTSYLAALNKAIKNQKSLRIPGIAKITPNATTKTMRAVTVHGLKIELLGDVNPLKSTIYLASSRAKVAK